LYLLVTDFYLSLFKLNKRTMKLKSLFSLLLIAGATATIAPSCKSKPKDADVKTKVEAAVANPAVSVDVKDGAVTLSGEVSDESAKVSAESAANGLKKEGVTSVANNITVFAPPPPAPVEISADAALTEAVNAAIKAYSGVKAEVKDGVVILSGEIKKADQRVLMPILQALKPKKVDNAQLTIK
jgi:hyperosmotically inducible protein